MEEANLKEKLCNKRALVLYRALLRQCGITDANDEHVIALNENLIQPIFDTQDPELSLLAIECIGLVSLIHKDAWLSYGKIFLEILQEDTGSSPEVNYFGAKDKAVALRAASDALIVHGIEDNNTQVLFGLITGPEYQFHPNPHLRQISVEGACKMMFSKKLCDDYPNSEHIESLLAYLLVQLFERQSLRLQRQASATGGGLIRSIITVFF